MLLTKTEPTDALTNLNCTIQKLGLVTNPTIKLEETVNNFSRFPLFLGGTNGKCEFP